MKRSIHPTGAAKPIAPYSPAVRSGDLLFLSGQIALDPVNGSLCLTSIEEETHQVMRNLGALLEAAGAGFDQVVKCTIFLSSMEHYHVVNEVYAGYFKEPYPAREAVAVKSLPRSVNVEISAVASLAR